MDWELILQIVITSVIAPSIILVVKAVIAYISTKTDGIADENLRLAINSALDDLERAALTAVSETEQVYVQALKAEGKFDKAAQSTALQRACARTQEIMTDYAYALIDDVTGHAEDMIRAKIEELVGE